VFLCSPASCNTHVTLVQTNSSQNMAHTPTARLPDQPAWDVAFVSEERKRRVRGGDDTQIWFLREYLTHGGLKRMSSRSSKTWSSARCGKAVAAVALTETAASRTSLATVAAAMRGNIRFEWVKESRDVAANGWVKTGGRYGIEVRGLLICDGAG